MAAPDPADERLQEFENFLRLLAAEDADCEQLSETFTNLYRDGWRHSYSEITGLLTDDTREEVQHVRIFGTCMQNLQRLEDRLYSLKWDCTEFSHP